RITRDLPRKLSWNDRVIGAMRLVLEQGIEPKILSEGAKSAVSSLFGNSRADIRNGLNQLWPTPWSKEHEKLLAYLSQFNIQ
ncbi:MAG: hypothetical protein WC071_12690, partial [Victivallaceae bacterium]